MDTYSRIKRLRQERGWTQTEMAQKMGYSDKAVISKIEHGEIDLPLSKVEAFANIFGVHPGDLMGDVPVVLQVSEHEKAVIIAYRQNPSMQDAVDRLLGVEKKEGSSLSQRKEA